MPASKHACSASVAMATLRAGAPRVHGSRSLDTRSLVRTAPYLRPPCTTTTRMDKPVLLTGAGGRVGQAILGHLGDRYHWRLLDREPLSSDKIPETVSDADVFVADVTDDYAVRNAVDGVGAVIHLAGDPRPEAPWDSVLRNNIDGTQTILDAAVDAGVERFVFASS